MSNARTIAANAAWMLTDRVLTLGLTFVVSVIVSRYLGPARFGALAYAESLVALFSVAGHMGLAGLILKSLVEDESSQQATMGTALVLKFVGCLAGLSCLAVYLIASEDFLSEVMIVTAIVALSLVFNPATAIEFWFQSKLKSKYVSYSQLVSVAFSSLLRLASVYLCLGVYWFASAKLFQATLLAALLVFFYQRSGMCIGQLAFSWAHARSFLRNGSLVFAGSVLAMVYTKIDQIMIRDMLSLEDVGRYAVAAQLSEVWYFVPSVVATSLFPSLIKASETSERLYECRVQRAYDMLFALAVVLALATSFVAGPLIGVLYGEVYSASAGVLVVHIWACVFIFMRAVFSKCVLVENALTLSLFTHGMGAIANICLNLILIPLDGIRGAAIATLVSYSVASYFSLVLFSKSRRHFRMMTYSLVSPFRYAFSSISHYIGKTKV